MNKALLWHDTNLYRDDSEYAVPCSPSHVSNSKNVEAVPINLYLLSNKAENQDSFLDRVRLEIVYVKHKGALPISVYAQNVRSSFNCVSVVFVDASKLQVYISIILAIDSI